MKTFEFIGAPYINSEGNLAALTITEKFESLEKAVEYVEKNNGWFADSTRAFKVVLIE